MISCNLQPAKYLCSRRQIRQVTRVHSFLKVEHTVVYVVHKFLHVEQSHFLILRVIHSFEASPAGG